jgi:hypothetical protein
MDRKAASAAMTLANMRGLGVRSVDVTCGCGRESIVDVSAVDGAVEVPGLKHRMRCSACGRRPIFVRPNWLEMWAPGMGKPTP